MNPQFWWYVARASGIVAWILLVASLVWGVLLATRVLRPHDRPAWLLDLHRALGGLAVVATGLHLLALVADSYITFGVMDLMVPFASQWKPGAVALGVIGAYLIVAIQVTSMAMRRLPRSAWRAVHLTSYALVWVVSLHAGLAGSDVENRIYQFVALLLTIGAVTATTTRVLHRRPPRGGADSAPARIGSDAP